MKATLFYSSLSVLFNFLINWASNVAASLLLNTYRHHLTKIFLCLVNLCLCLCLNQGIFVSDTYDLFFIIVFISIVINHIMSFNQTHLLLRRFFGICHTIFFSIANNNLIKTRIKKSSGFQSAKVQRWGVA